MAVKTRAMMLSVLYLSYGSLSWLFVFIRPFALQIIICAGILSRLDPFCDRLALKALQKHSEMLILIDPGTSLNPSRNKFTTFWAKEKYWCQLHYLSDTNGIRKEHKGNSTVKLKCRFCRHFVNPHVFIS